MQLTFVTDLGQSYSMDINSGMELENVMVLLEAESGIPVVKQSVSYNEQDINAPKSTLRKLGVNEASAMLLLRCKVPVPNVAGRALVEQDSEMMCLATLTSCTSCEKYNLTLWLLLSQTRSVSLSCCNRHGVQQMIMSPECAGHNNVLRRPALLRHRTQGPPQATLFGYP
ncbi:hypothetical protein B0H14DRAFT_3137034 [Mycena olivaceomarginata]|nr:hypothetical protein B0H14DRAFT_3137034 [Mycena olivaceomarginata]